MQHKNFFHIISLCITLLLVIQSSNCDQNDIDSTSINQTDTNRIVTFRSKNMVRVKGEMINEFICRSAFQDLCSNISEIVCVLNHLGKLVNNTCVVMNKDSTSYHSLVAIKKTTCNGDKFIKGQCYLIITPKYLNKSAVPIKWVLERNADGSLKMRDDVFDNQHSFGKPVFRENDPFDTPFFKEKYPFDTPFFRDNQKKWDDDEWKRRTQQSDQIGQIFMYGFVCIVALVFFLAFIAICKGIYEETGCCECFKSKPIISESARRRISFPRTNYAISSTSMVQAGTSFRSNGQFISQTSNSNSDFDTKKFDDKPPEYDMHKFGIDPPSYSSLDNVIHTNPIGTINQGYIPETVQPATNQTFSNLVQSANNQPIKPSNPSAPDF